MDTPRVTLVPAQPRQRHHTSTSTHRSPGKARAHARCPNPHPRSHCLQDPASYAHPRSPGPSAVPHSPLLRSRLHNLQHHNHHIHHHHHVLIQHSTPQAAGETSQTGPQNPSPPRATPPLPRPTPRRGPNPQPSQNPRPPPNSHPNPSVRHNRNPQPKPSPSPSPAPRRQRQPDPPRTSSMTFGPSRPRPGGSSTQHGAPPPSPMPPPPPSWRSAPRLKHNKPRPTTSQSPHPRPTDHPRPDQIEARVHQQRLRPPTNPRCQPTYSTCPANAATARPNPTPRRGPCAHTKEGPYQDRPPLCPFRLLFLLTCSGSAIAFLKFQAPKSKSIENVILLQP